MHCLAYSLASYLHLLRKLLLKTEVGTKFYFSDFKSTKIRTRLKLYMLYVANYTFWLVFNTQISVNTFWSSCRDQQCRYAVEFRLSVLNSMQGLLWWYAHVKELSLRYLLARLHTNLSSATYWSTSMVCELVANIQGNEMEGATNKTTEGRVRQRFALIRDVPRANLDRNTGP